MAEDGLTEGAVMTVTATPGQVRHAVEAGEGLPHWSWFQWASAVAGTSSAVLVAASGTPGWQVLRFVMVACFAAGIVRVSRSRNKSTLGRAGVALGVPLVAIAAGFAPHWVAGRVGVVPIASAVLAVAALLLAVLGVRAVARSRQWWRRVLTGSAVFVALAVTAYVLGPAVAATNPPHADLGAAPDTVGLTFVDVPLRTSDGVDLAGWYVASSNRAAVVLLHGAGSTRSDVLDHAAVLAEAGFGVLMIDARGHGESGGGAMDFGWDGDTDIAAATAFLASRPDVDPGRIGLVGVSMGAEQALGASGTDPLVRAVVAEGATARVAADEAWLSDRYGLRGRFTEQLEVVQDWATSVLTDADKPGSMGDAVAASDATAFLLIAAEDEPDEVEAAAFIAGAAPDRVTTWTVPGASHTSGLRTARDEWIVRVTSFLGDHLLDER
jgi:esterase/lipase